MNPSSQEHCDAIKASLQTVYKHVDVHDQDAFDDVSGDFSTKGEDGVDPIAELFELHFDMLWRLAKRQGLSDSDADDAIQETYLIATEKLGQFEGKSQLRTWLCGILMRVCWRTHTKTRKQSRLINKIKKLCLPSTHEATSSLEYAPLYKALNSLPDKQREALWLVDVEGFSLKELATIASVPLNTAASRVREARKVLSKKAVRLGMR